MAQDTLITPLNFNDSLIGQSWIDKKTGIEVSIGYVSGLPADLSDIAYESGDIGISFMDRGIGQRELDMACQKLAEECLAEDFELLLTKSDFPFDARWYMIGNLGQSLDAAKMDRISLPFSNFLYDEIQDHINKYKR
jgi:hypothetical protein